MLQGAVNKMNLVTAYWRGGHKDLDKQLTELYDRQIEIEEFLAR
jgi:hypothetical protein